MNILLLGKNGMLGSDICTLLSQNPKIILTALDKEDVDITDENAIREKIINLNPEILINCAAYTDVDGCEKNKDLAFSVNGHALDYISDVCKKTSSKLVHFSTDYIFNGLKKEGYNEDDEPGPINVYGESKLMAEKYIQENLGKEGSFAIIRISFLFGPNGENFVKKILRAAENQIKNGKNFIKVVDTQVSCPTYTKDLAKRVPDFFDKKLNGIFHLTNSGAVSKYEFAKEIFNIKNIDIKVIPCDESEFPLPAKRPAFSALNNNKIELLPSFIYALQDYLFSYFR